MKQLLSLRHVLSNYQFSLNRDMGITRILRGNSERYKAFCNSSHDELQRLFSFGVLRFLSIWLYCRPKITAYFTIAFVSGVYKDLIGWQLTIKQGMRYKNTTHRWLHELAENWQTVMSARKSNKGNILIPLIELPLRVTNQYTNLRTND